MRFRTTLFLSLVLLFCTLGAKADTVTYTETATASGSLGSTDFTNATVTLTGTGSTSSISSSSGIFDLLLPVTVQISGITGTAELSDTIQVVDNQAAMLAGFGDITTDFAILFDDASAFSSYNLGSSIGPVVGSAVLNSGTFFKTNNGHLILDSVSNVSFQAVDTSAATPEPSSFALLGTGLLGVAGGLRRKFSTR